MSNKIFILTAEKGEGKTTFLHNACKGCTDAAGILTPVINAQRFFYDIAASDFFKMEADAIEEEKLFIGKYAFSKKSFDKAAEILLQYSSKTNINYLLLDEIGPLEIVHQKGFYQSLCKILSTPLLCNLVIVVRPSLVNEAVQLISAYQQVPIIIPLPNEYNTKCDEGPSQTKPQLQDYFKV